MTRYILLIASLVLACNLSAQSDEANGAVATELSATYECENSEISNFQGFTKSAEFNCVDYDFWVDSWYTFTPTETKMYAIEIESLNSNNQNVRIGIFTGTPGNLTSQTGCATRYYSAVLNSGQTYYINARGASETTQYRMCVYPFPDSPDNNDTANAEEILESTIDMCENSVVGYTANASTSGESYCTNSNPDVWYTFTPTESAEYTFSASLVNGAAPLSISLYNGTPGFLNPLSEEFPSQTNQCEDIVLGDLEANETYYINVTSALSSQAIYFDLCVYKSPAPPSNDDCTNPIALNVGQSFEDSFIVATNTSATINPGNSNFPSCGTLDFSTRGRDIWFTVVVPESGSFTIETRVEPDETNLYDTAIETYTGSCGTDTLEPYYYNLPPPNTTTAYCNDQFVIGGNQFAGILFTDKTPGETVIVRVWGWSQQFGEFRIAAYDSSTLSTDEVESNELEVYPNPIKNEVNISYSNIIDEVVIYDIRGKEVLKNMVNNNYINLNTNSLESGLYIIKVKSEDNVHTYKIVKN